MIRWIPVHLTDYQAQVVIDALDLYTEGAQRQQTQRELQAARAVRRKVSAALMPGSGGLS